MRKLIIGLTLVTFVLFVYTSHATVVKQDKQKTQVTAEKKTDSKTTTATTGDKKCADKKDCKKDAKCCKDKGTKACCKKDGQKCDKDSKKVSEPKK
jgi:hypothetical protein